MRNIWARIGLGAALVFAAGMLVVTLAGQVRAAAGRAVDRTVARVGTAIASAPARSNLPFLLGGSPVGSIRHLRMLRETSGGLPDLRLTVDLTASPADLDRCVLVPAAEPELDPEKGFRCAGQRDGGRITVGRVRFEPGGFERPIRVGPSVERELRRGEPFEVEADLGGSVRVSAHGDSGEIVNLRADSAGVLLHVQDGLERAVLRLLADSTGASLRVRGDDGKVVRVEASQSGLHITVDSAARR